MPFVRMRRWGSALRGGRALATEPIVPLTERVLMRVGWPRPFWILAWGLLLFVTIESANRLYHLPGYLGVSYSIVCAYIASVSLWGVGRLTRALNENQPLITGLNGGTEDAAGSRPFQFVGSVAGPLLLSLIVNLVWVTEFFRYPGLASATMFLLFFVGWLPANCALWVCVALFLELDKLGRRPLQLKPFHQDRSLGLDPLGKAAFSSFLLLAAVLLPYTIVAVRDVRSAAVALVYIFLATTFFFMSVYRLHRQLVAAKRHYLSRVRSLYAEALPPLESAWSLETVSAQSGHLYAVEVLQRQVADIREWPFNEALVARVAAIVTSVLGIIAARLILSRFGL